MGECNLVIPRSVLEIVGNQEPLRVMRLKRFIWKFLAAHRGPRWI